MTAFAMPARVPVPALIGREREQTALRDRFAAACGGHGGLVLIGGEAGIGKTALAESLCREAAAQGALVLIGHCHDLTETPPYGPWVELFGRYEPADGMPPLPAAFAERGTVGEVTSQAALFQQGQDFFIAVARQRPILLLLDDLHWADLASLDLLRFLARALATLRVLLVVTYRADELTRRHPLYTLLPTLVRESAATRLDLRPLRPEDIAALVHARYGLPDADAAPLVAYLHDRSEGNPFFLGELLRTLEEESVLRHSERGWALGALAGVRMPPLLRQVIDGRLARLGEEAQRLLAMAAVIGQDVPLAVWSSVTQTDEETLLGVTERAIEAHLASATETSLHFAHALIREALYEGIVPLRRRGLHQRVAEAMAAQATPDADVIAYHFQHAGDARAAMWFIKAGERAQRAFAWLTATERYETALTLLPETDLHTRGWLLYWIGRLQIVSARYLPYFEEASRLAEVLGDRALATVTQYGHGLLRVRVGGKRGPGLAELAAGAEAIEALAPADRARVRAAGVTAAEREAPRGTVLLHTGLSGPYVHALALGEEWLIPTATAPDADPESPIWAEGWAGLAYIYIGLGRPAEARTAFERALAAFERDGFFTQFATLQWIMLRWLMLRYTADNVREREQMLAEAITAGERGRGLWDGPLEWLATGLRFVEARWDDAAFAQSEMMLRGERQAPPIRAQRLYLAMRHRERGERREAWVQVNGVLPGGIATEMGDVQLILGVEMQYVAVALALDEGNLFLAREWLDAHDRWLAWSGAVLGQSEGQALWAQYHRQAGDMALAVAHAERALAHATEPRQPLALLAAHRLLGELHTDAGHFEGADHHLQESLTLADACAAPYERALTLLVIAELRATTGKREEARQLLDEARAICTPLGAKPALARADALAERLSAAATRAPQYPGGLSAREVEVLRLVAAGMTDTQVAERLFLSPRTVGQHLRNIYNKLGVSTRNAAARWATDHDLT